MATPADELRTAAARLRALAADATPGPWFAHHPEPRHWGDADHDTELVGCGKHLAVLNAEYNGALNADYAAVMHPDVGAALADWLEASAEYAVVSIGHPTHVVRALAVARLINGSTT